MYAYKIKPWKTDNSCNSLKPVSTTFLNSSSDGVESKTSEQSEADDCFDEAAPLPSLSGRENSGPPVSVRRGIFAKDKRKMREKRRSTGVANLNENNEEEDSETLANTSVNEVVSENNLLSQINESCEDGDEDGSSFGDEVITQNDSKSLGIPQTTVNSFTKLSSSSPVCTFQDQPAGNISPDNIVTSASPRPKSCLKTPPVIGKKPDLPQRHGRSQSANYDDTVPLPEVSKMVQQIAVLEQKLETERRKNLELTQQLTDKDTRIEELVREIQGLNEDLDAVDEECKGLEAENKALLKAMTQLSSPSVKHK